MLSPAAKVFLLLAVNLFNVVYIASHVRRVLYPSVQPPSDREYSYRAHDYPEFLPLPFEVEMVPVTIEESVHYPPAGAPADGQWSSIASPSFGYIRLGPEDRTFVVTMFHELHCLRMINRAFTKMQGANVGHIKHCLNYLRQDILCSPDLTLEPGNFEERDFEVDRIGGTHMCVNWNPIYDWVDNNFDTWTNKTGWHWPETGSDKEAHVS